MAPEVLDRIEQMARLAAMFSPLALLLFKSVRTGLGNVVVWAWKPFAEQFAKRDTVLNQLTLELREFRANTDASFASLDTKLAIMTGIAKLAQDTARDIGYFECSSDGRNVWVSDTYARWMKTETRHLLGWGYVGLIHPEDREQVLQEWASCREQHRDYRGRPRMGPPGGPYREYDVLLRPIPEAPPAVAWAGTIAPVSPTRRHDDQADHAHERGTWHESDSGGI